MEYLEIERTEIEENWIGGKELKYPTQVIWGCQDNDNRKRIVNGT